MLMHPRRRAPCPWQVPDVTPADVLFFVRSISRDDHISSPKVALTIVTWSPFFSFPCCSRRAASVPGMI